MNRQEWLKERKTYIGGSDLGSICGVNKYKTPLDVYLEKTSDSVEEIDNQYTHWGNILEGVIAKEYARVTGNKVVEPIGTLRHKEHEFLGANVDYFVNGGEFILECKTASIRVADEWGEAGTDQIPDSYKCQVAYYAAIADVPKVDIAVLIGGNDFRIYTYHRNKDLETKLLQVAVNFWHNHIVKNNPPEASNLQDLENLYPSSNGMEVTISDEVLQDVQRLNELKEHAKSVDEEVKALQESIKKYMKDNEILVDSSGHVFATWKTGKARIALDTKKLQAEHQGIYQQYLHECKAPRTFRLK